MPDTTELAELRRRALDPMRSRLEPALMADAFLTLATARGMTIHPDNLGAPAHRIGPATAHIEAPMAQNVRPLVATIDDARSRVAARIRAMYPTGGDAA
jgi:hypothetical protein